MKKNNGAYFIPFADRTLYPDSLILVSSVINLQDDHELAPALKNGSDFLNF